MFPINMWFSLATAVTCILYSCEIFLDLLVLLPSLPGNHYLWFWGFVCYQSNTWNTQGGLLWRWQISPLFGFYIHVEVVEQKILHWKDFSSGQILSPYILIMTLSVSLDFGNISLRYGVPMTLQDRLHHNVVSAMRRLHWIFFFIILFKISH